MLRSIKCRIYSLIFHILNLFFSTILLIATINKKNYPIAVKTDFNGPSSRGFITNVNDSEINGFIVFDGGQYFAYENKCPHTGAPLDWVEHQFLDADSALIQCSVHDARFTMDTGECIFGPCSGDHLIPLNITVKDDVILLQT